MNTQHEHLLLVLAKKGRMTWGGVESFVHPSGRRALVENGMVRQHPDYSGMAILTEDGLDWVERARREGYTLDAYE